MGRLERRGGNRYISKERRPLFKSTKYPIRKRETLGVGGTMRQDMGKTRGGLSNRGALEESGLNLFVYRSTTGTGRAGRGTVRNESMARSRRFIVCKEKGSRGKKLSDR